MPKVSLLIRFLLSQLGYQEQGGPDGHSGNLTKFGKAYGWNGVAWCSIFVWFAFMQPLAFFIFVILEAAYRWGIAATRAT